MRTHVQTQRCALYEIDPRTGATIEFFCVDRTYARSVGVGGAGWYWRERGSTNPPSGPFVTCYGAYRDATRTIQVQTCGAPAQISRRTSCKP